MMQYRYLPFYQSLYSNPQQVLGLWLIHGDDELLHSWLIERLRPALQAQGQRIERFELSSQKSWHEVLTRLYSPSLFDAAVALVVTGKHKPDDTTLQALVEVAQDTQAGATQNTLLWLLPKQDKKAQTTKVFKRFVEFGNVVDAQLHDERMRLELLALKANELGMTLTEAAWQTLMSHTEANLVAAHQALWRLSLLYAGQMVDADELMEGLVSDSQYNVFNLSDAVLQGDVPTGLKILYQLKHHDTAPSVVLWAFAKDIQILAAMQAGKSPQSLGVWRNKTRLYEQALQRINTYPDSLAELTALLYHCDRAIKGLHTDSPWRYFEDMTLQMAGLKLWS